MESLPIPPRPSFFKALNAANNANQSPVNNNHSHPSSPPTYSRIQHHHQQQQSGNNRDSPKFSSGARPPPPYPTRTSSSSLQQRPLPVPNSRGAIPDVGSGGRSSSINERGSGAVTTFFQNRGEYFSKMFSPFHSETNYCRGTFLVEKWIFLENFHFSLFLSFLVSFLNFLFDQCCAAVSA